MKKLIAIILSALLGVSLFGVFAYAAEGDEWSAKVADPDQEWITELNENGEFPGDVDGNTALYSVDFVDFTFNGTDSVTVNSACLRYHIFLVLEKIGTDTYKVRQFGNNIVWNRDGFQHDIALKDGDLILSFYYNLNNGFVINQAHYDAYDYVSNSTGSGVYNEAVNAVNDLYVYIDGNDITYSKVPFVPDVVDTSDETPESSAREQSAQPSSAAETSSDGDTPSTGDSGITVLVVITVISLAAAFIIKRRA